MPVRRTTIEKDVYVVDLEEIGERKVPRRVSATCERSKRDHEDGEGRGREEGGREGTKDDLVSFPTPSTSFPSPPPQQHNFSSHGYDV